MLLATLAVAFAQDSTAFLDEAGMAHARAFVAQSEAEVREALRDPEVAAALPPEVLKVHTLSGGACVTLGITVKGAWDPLTYTTQRCPTASGYTYRLLNSDSITAYEAEWSLSPRPGGGTEVNYKVRTEVDLPVPATLVRKGVLQSAKDTVLALVRRVTRGR